MCRLDVRTAGGRHWLKVCNRSLHIDGSSEFQLPASGDDTKKKRVLRTVLGGGWFMAEGSVEMPHTLSAHSNHLKWPQPCCRFSEHSKPSRIARSHRFLLSLEGIRASTGS